MSEKPKSFWSELKRRNIFRVATDYLVVGWLIIEVGDAIFEPLHLPSWAFTIIIVFVISGSRRARGITITKARKRL